MTLCAYCSSIATICRAVKIIVGLKNSVGGLKNCGSFWRKIANFEPFLVIYRSKYGIFVHENVIFIKYIVICV